jgi:diguanylate cyclase (GGDEF)-like protein/PAS domain S-box-containing protein
VRSRDDGAAAPAPEDDPAALRAALAEQAQLRAAAEKSLYAALRQIDRRQKELRIVEELSGIGSFYWIVDADSMWWSEQAAAVFRLGPAGPPPSRAHYLELVHPDDREVVGETLRRAVESVTEYDLEYRMVLGGRVREVRCRGRVEVDLDGPAVTGSLQDITDARAASRQLRESRDRFAGVLNAATDQCIMAMDDHGRITVFNAGAERMLGWTAPEVLGRTPEQFHDPAELAARAAELGLEPGWPVIVGEAAGGGAETRDWTYLTRDGRRLRAMVTVNAQFDPEGAVSGYISVGTDISDRIRAQVELQESESRFRDTFEFAPNGMMLLSAEPDDVGRFVKVNPALCELTGYTAEQLVGMNIYDLTHEDHRTELRRRASDVGCGELDIRPTERHWVHADGHDLWIQLALSPLHSVEMRYLVGQVDDITDRKQAEARLTHQALHDWLTGLPNRLLLMDRIEHALAAGSRSGRLVGLLYIDLDGFKAVNDTGGHAAGDHTLIHIGDRIRQVVRPGDTVARLGGDEFVVVCSDLDGPAVAVHIAERVLDAIRVPHRYLGRTYTLGASIGVSMSRADSQPDTMLREADEAMYAGKVAGKGRVRISGVHPAEVGADRTRAREQARLTAELRAAVDRGELALWGQPIHDMAEGRIVAVEQLLRWNHPERGVLEPADFLDLADAADLLTALGRRVLLEACALAREWLDGLGTAAPSVHVNVAGRQLDSGRLLTDVLDALRVNRLPADRLVLELAETHLPMLTDQVRTDLETLRERGVRLALDDLGTGHASLGDVIAFPVDLLKVDVDSVRRMNTDSTARATVAGILAIGRALGVPVIAEGVETDAQLAALLAAGCELGQGFLLGRAMPAEAVRETLGLRR